MTEKSSPTLLRRLDSVDAHHRFALAFALAFAAFFACWSIRLPVRIILSWDAWVLSLLALAWSRILTADPRHVAKLARIGHTSRKLVLGCIVLAACASLMAVAFLLITAKGLHGTPLGLHILLALGTVILSWLVVHTIFALHYAFLYYRPALRPEDPHPPGGLQFPETPEPDYMDFAYFSFVLGMCSQVSDVQVSSRQLRRWALVHGVVAFGFNTAVLAMSLNIVSGLF